MAKKHKASHNNGNKWSCGWITVFGQTKTKRRSMRESLKIDTTPIHLTIGNLINSNVVVRFFLALILWFHVPGEIVLNLNFIDEQIGEYSFSVWVFPMWWHLSPRDEMLFYVLYHQLNCHLLCTGSYVCVLLNIHTHSPICLAPMNSEWVWFLWIFLWPFWLYVVAIGRSNIVYEHLIRFSALRLTNVQPFLR